MIDWKYLLIGIIRRFTPHQILFTVMKYRGDGNSMEQPASKLVSQMKKRMSESGISIEGKHVLDLGSGRYARIALALLAAGAKQVTLVDLFATSIEDPQHRNMLIEDCKTLGLNPESTFKQIQIINGDFLQLAPPTADQQVDLLISTSVLEHVIDPAAIFKTCIQWLRPGGLTIHQIDLRDHNLGFSKPFEMLAYSDTVWDRLINLQGGFHLNRWRASEYQKAFTDAGFIDIKEQTIEQDLAGAKAIRPRLAKRFQHLSDKDLAVQGLVLVGTRIV